MFIELTTEQKAVINHSLGRHARVLAVAGSGKTTTLAHRVKHLLTEQHVTSLTLFLLSRASAGICGQNIVVDGGKVMH